MLFTPPKVKSLSRYAEYGAYLTNRHFLLMLAVAFTVHIGIIAIYSMKPRLEIMRIPVRVLNIKLAGGGAGGMQMPSSSQVPMAKAPDEHEAAAEEPEMKSMPDEDVESAVDKALATHAKPVHAAPHVPLPDKGAHAAKEVHKSAHAGAEFTLATPKRYVRGGAGAAGKSGKAGTGNGSGISGDVGGNEVIERYTQTISQWIKNHQMEARERCAQAKESTGECDAKGQVVVRIRIDREGRILYNSVDHTSGKELVDQLAIQIVRASDPVPAVPSNYPSDSQLEFLVNVQVDLSAKQ